MYRVRHVLCIKIEQRQILPGLPEADYPQTGSRAHEERRVPEIRDKSKKALIYRASSVKMAQSDTEYLFRENGVLLRNILKSVPTKTGRGRSYTGFLRLFFF